MTPVATQDAPVRTLDTRDLLYRARLGAPWVMLILVATCIVVTIPEWIDARRYYLTLGVGFCEEDGLVRWWNHVVSKFVHGAGCGFPPIAFHLGVNATLFLVQGSIVERLLGSGRAALLTFTCFAVQITLVWILAGGRAHGASGMTWSYLLFSLHWVGWSWRQRRWATAKEPLSVFLALLSLFAIAGLVKHWHLWNLLASIPFYLAWRRTFAANLDALAEARALDKGARAANRAGVLAAAAIAAFCAFFVVMAVSGRVEPVSLGSHE